jgi:hypothetical protein
MPRNVTDGDGSVRLELRASASEVEQWRIAAQQEGLSMSEFIRGAAREAAKPSEFHQLMREIRQMIRSCESVAPGVQLAINLTPEHEATLSLAKNEEVGGQVLRDIIINGPREAFSKIFGHEVRWGAEMFSVGPADPKEYERARKGRPRSSS